MRAAALADWERVPSARAAHPREEHLLPLMVAVGAAGSDPAERIYHQDDFAGGIGVSNFMFAAGRASDDAEAVGAATDAGLRVRVQDQDRSPTHLGNGIARRSTEPATHSALARPRRHTTSSGSCW